MTYSPILFDLDGTLVDSVADLAIAVNLLRAELELKPLSLEKVRANVGDGATQLVTRSLPAGLYSYARLQRFLVLYGEHLADHTVPYPGIRECLEHLKDRPLAVVTNKPYALSLQLLETLDLLRYFPVVIGGDSCPVKKPDPTPIRLALHRLQAESTHALMVGDHHTDLKAGASAGIATCFCAWGLGEDGGVPCDHRVADVAALTRLLA